MTDQTTWPRLSEDLTGPRDPTHCQACGINGKIWANLFAWQEHDQADKPEPRVVVLCRRCGDKLIEPHPRLYHRLTKNAPWPGINTICLDCSCRDGVRCTHADLRANGGPGLAMKQVPPGITFFDGTRGGKRAGWHEAIYPEEPTECAGQEPR